MEVDVTRIAQLRQQAKQDFQAREGVKLSFLPFFAKAAVEALKAHPSVNSSIDQEAGTVTYHDTENLGIAVDTERGLLVPVLHNAGDLSLGGISRKIADLAERTRTNKITPDELGGGTFTLTNTGSRGALFDTPIINQPQVAILGTGAVVKRPVVVNDPDSARSSPCGRWSTWRSPTTTASSTAPTPPGSSPPCGSGWRPASSRASWASPELRRSGPRPSPGP